MFIGTYQHNIDSKSRVIIPAKFREELGETFMLTKGMNNCLFVLSMEQWQLFQDKIASLPVASGLQLVRFFCAGACDATPNAQGRILVPDNLRKYAQLDKDVTVIGTGNRVEIWNTEKWNEYLENQSQESIMQAMELLGI